jgi:hypothetical protein
MAGVVHRLSEALLSKCPHSHFPRGAHVFIIMRSGEKFEDVFEKNEGHGSIILRNRGELRLRGIRSIGYRKLKTKQK